MLKPPSRRAAPRARRACAARWPLAAGALLVTVLLGLGLSAAAPASRVGLSLRTVRLLRDAGGELLPAPAPLPGCADRDGAEACAAVAAGGCLGASVAARAFARCAAACGGCAPPPPLPAGAAAAGATVRLGASGVDMPLLGFGTAGLGDATSEAVAAALAAGYRRVDTAAAREWYREDLVGAALAAAAAAPDGPPRRELFLTTKVHPRDLGAAATRRSVLASLADLRTDYVDLVLIHYPECWGDICGGVQPEGDWRDSWAELGRLVAEGRVRAAGVSNFDVAQLAEVAALAAAAGPPLALVQRRSDPLHQDRAAQAFCRAAGVRYEGYSSLGGQYGSDAGGSNRVLDHAALRSIAEAHGATPARVALRWALQSGASVVPRSRRADHIAANADVWGFELSRAEMEAIVALDEDGE